MPAELENDGWFYSCELIPTGGQLREKGIYKNGKEEGEWFYYRINGGLNWTGTCRDGKREGLWEYYDGNGTKDSKLSAFYKNGKKVE